MTESDGAESVPVSIDCIEENLWLGNSTAANDINTLEKLNITSIITIDSCPLTQKIIDLKYITTKYIQVTDTTTEDLLSYFEECYEFIETGLQKGSVLVHCYFGVSRSATIIISYIMKKKSMSLDQAVEFVKSKRRYIGPNPGFMSQLKLYENMKCVINKTNVQYKMFRLFIAADCVKKVKIVPQSCADVIKSDPSVITVNPDPKVFRCRKCRRIIALTSNIIPHMPKEKYSWRDKRWSEDIEKSDYCKKIYFIEPMVWMSEVTSSLEGKIKCPNTKCNSKLGSFSWIKGKCSLDSKILNITLLHVTLVSQQNMINYTFQVFAAISLYLKFFRSFGCYAASIGVFLVSSIGKKTLIDVA